MRRGQNGSRSNYFYDIRTIERNISNATVLLAGKLDETFEPVFKEFGEAAAKAAIAFCLKHEEVFDFIQKNEMLAVRSNFGVGPLASYYNVPDTNSIAANFLNVEVFLTEDDRECLRKHEVAKHNIQKTSSLCLEYLRALSGMYSNVGYLLIAAPEIKPFADVDPDFRPTNKNYYTRDNLDIPKLELFTDLALKCSMEGVKTSGH